MSPADTHSEFVITRTDWAGYTTVRRALWDTRLRMTYSRGRLELMTPSPRHEKRKSLLVNLLGDYLLEREIDYEQGGSTTFQDAALEQGLEPDDCFWLGSLSALRGQEDAASRPDLVIEIEVSHSAMNRLPLFLQMGVPEVWRYTPEGRLVVHALLDGEYRVVESSPTLPELPLPDLGLHMALGREQGTLAARRSWRQLLRS